METLRLQKKYLAEEINLYSDSIYLIIKQIQICIKMKNTT